LTFTAEKANGSVELTFTFNSSALKGKEVVVFETLYYGEKKVAVHADIKDEGQTVKFVKLSDSSVTTAPGKSGTVSSVKTSDNTTVGMLLGVLAVSGCAAGIHLYRMKKKKG